MELRIPIGRTFAIVVLYAVAGHAAEHGVVRFYLFTFYEYDRKDLLSLFCMQLPVTRRSTGWCACHDGERGRASKYGTSL